MHLALILSLAVAVIAVAPEPKENVQRDLELLEIEVLTEGGVRFRHPHTNGMSYFAVHFSINQPLVGLQFGQYNPEAFSPTGEDNYWELVDAEDVILQPGDEINFWAYAVILGVGHSDIDNQHVVPQPTGGGGDCNCDCNCGGGGGGGASSEPVCTSYPCLIFEDNFDSEIDLEFWEHEITAGGGGNWEFQFYTNNRTNSYIKDGTLHLKPTLAALAQEDINWPNTGTLDLWGTGKADMCTGNKWFGCERVAAGGRVINPVQSARLRTSRSFSFKYGRIEIEAKLPRGDWIWPAIWLLPTNQYYGTWPSSGEIDLMEGRGNAEYYDPSGTHAGIKQVGQTMHWGPWWPENRYDLTTSSTNLASGDFADDFHKYRMDWDESGVKLYVDDVLRTHSETGEGYWKKGEWDQKFGEVENVWEQGGRDAPFDKPFHLIMNVAVGGTGGYFPDTYQNRPYGKPWNDLSEFAMNDFWNTRNLWMPTWPESDERALRINYVRVWKLTKDD